LEMCKTTWLLNFYTVKVHISMRKSLVG